MTSAIHDLTPSTRFSKPGVERRRSTSWAVGLLLGVYVGTAGVRISVGPLDLPTLLVIACFLFVVTSNIAAVKTYRFNVIDFAMTLLIFVLLITELINAELLLRTASPYMSLNWVKLLIIYMTARLVISDRISAVSFIKGLLAFAPVVSLFALMQVAKVPTILELTFLLTDSSSTALSRFVEEGKLIRATGFIGHWTGLGGYLLVMTLGMLVLMRLEGRSVKRICFVAVVGVGVVSTFTFSIVLAYIVLVTSYFIGERKIGSLTIFFSTTVSLALFWFGDIIERRFLQQYGSNEGALASSRGIVPETLIYRMNIWQNETIPAILERPILGWGNGVYQQGNGWAVGPTTIIWPSPESQWFGIMTQAGVFGFVALIGVVGSLFVTALKSHGRLKHLIGIFLVLSLFISFTVSLFTNAGFPGALILLFAALSQLRSIGVTDPMVS